jgi:hypothetical protein
MQVVNFSSDKTTVIVPAGTYILGDPCYCVPESKWSEAGESNGWFEDSPVATIVVNGVEREFLGFGTTYGDGEYYDSLGRSYCVDSGLIGLVPLDIAALEEIGSWVQITFSEDTVVTNRDGFMTFGTEISIATDSLDYEDDGEDEDEDVYDD